MKVVGYANFSRLAPKIGYQLPQQRLLSDRANKIGLIVPTHMSTYPENLVNIGPAHSEIIAWSRKGPTVKKESNTGNEGKTGQVKQWCVVQVWICTGVLRPRHQCVAHGGRAPAKTVRAPAKITGLIMFHLGCQTKCWYFGAFLVLKNRKRPNGNPVFHGGCSRRLSHTHSY